MAEFKIENRIIGDNYAPVVIAEIGINHEGSLETAIKIADAAINSGAEIIKHQTHIIEDEMSDEAKLVIPSHTKDSIYDIMKRCAHLFIISYMESFVCDGITNFASSDISSSIIWVWCLIISAPLLIAASAILIAVSKDPSWLIPISAITTGA